MTEIPIETQKENAIKWIEALLSGKYKQGKERLGDEEIGFCCLGLGCKVVGKEFHSLDEWDDNFHMHVGFMYANASLREPFYGKFNLALINDRTSAGFKRIGKMLIKRADDQFIPEVAEAIKKHFNN